MAIITESRGAGIVAAALAQVVVVETYGICNPGRCLTVSELLRLVFRTHTPAGRAAFVAALLAGVIALIPHICKDVTAR